MISVDSSRFPLLLLLFGVLMQGPVFTQERITLDLEEGKSGAVWDLALGPEGRTLFSCGRDSSAKSWDLRTGEAIRMFRNTQPTLITSMSLERGGGILALGDMNGMLSVWDAESGIAAYEIPAHESYITSVDISEDGESIVTAGRDGNIHAWRRADATKLWAVHMPPLWFNAIAIAPDGKHVVSAGQDGRIGLWRLSDGKFVRGLGRHSRFAKALHFSHDGLYLFSSGADGSIRVWNMITMSLFREMQLDEGYAHTLHLDSSEDLLLVGKMNGLIELWDWKRRSRKEKLSGESYGTMAALFSPDDKRIYSAHTNGAVKVWNSDGTLLLDMVGFSDGQWLSFTPDGFYDCSAYGDRYVRWRRGQELFPLERYSEIYRRPAIIEDVLRGGYTPAAAVEQIVDPPVLRLLAPRDGQLFAFGSEELEVIVEAEATDNTRIGSIAFSLNGRRLPKEQLLGWTVLEHSDRRLHVRARLRVLPGKNIMEAIAFNAARVRSERAGAEVTVQTNERLDPDLYVLAVGSDAYAPHYPDLQFAGIDAEALVDELSRQEGGMYTRVYGQALTGKDVSKETVLSALRNLRDIEAADVLLLFFSGHGVRERDANGRSKYYYLPTGSTRTNIPNEGLAWDDIATEVRQLGAGRVILLLDACHSGDIANSASNEKVAASLAGDIGIVFTSSSGNEYSFEDPSWGHGAFTRALLDGLRGEADFTRDGTVDWSELQLYVTTSVRHMTRGSQNPMVPRLEQFSNFDFVRVRQ
jgi:WD40 repeat protein